MTPVFETKFSLVLGFLNDLGVNIFTKLSGNTKFSDDKTSNEIIQRGLLEKIFGGVGTQQELPTTP